MSFGPTVTCEELAQHVQDPTWVVFDCRYDLTDKEKGVREYAKAHVPGAFFAHIDRDLSGPVGDGHKGRHPLPFEGAFQRFCSTHGVGPGTKVVCYDDVAGQWASRLWWLLRHYGHKDVAVLDGGLTRWKSLRLPLRAQHENHRQASFTGKPGSMPTVDLTAIERSLLLASGTAQEGATTQAFGATHYLLLDARAAERFRGDVEPVDKRPGHIPGAKSLPFAGAVGPDMRFLPAEQLRQRFAAAGWTGDGRSVACYCGSGVTGPHLVLEAELAGLPTPALYPGSYSEWQFPAAGRPVELGAAGAGTADAA